MKKKGYNRILVESGLNFLSALLVKKLVYNLYIFKSATKLGNNGLNKTPINLIKGIKMQNKIKVNLNGEELYKVKIK